MTIDADRAKAEAEVGVRGALEAREKGIHAWLLENAPFTFADQKHLDENTPERAYYHLGYRCAIKDALALAKRPAKTERGAVVEDGAEQIAAFARRRPKPRKSNP